MFDLQITGGYSKNQGQSDGSEETARRTDCPLVSKDNSRGYMGIWAGNCCQTFIFRKEWRVVTRGIHGGGRGNQSGR